MSNKFYTVNPKEDYDRCLGPYLWTNVNRRDFFSWEGAWAESWDSEEMAIHAAKQRTAEGWIVDCYKSVGYTAAEHDRDEDE